MVDQGVGREHVGSKCVKLWQMAETMSPLVPVPTAIALPFSAWPRLLSLPENGGAAGALNSGDITGFQAEELVRQVPTPPLASHPSSLMCHGSLSCRVPPTWEDACGAVQLDKTVTMLKYLHIVALIADSV